MADVKRKNKSKKLLVEEPVVVEETRGRKANPRKIQHNGLFEDQNERIKLVAGKEAVDAAIILRRIVDWYFDAKEVQEAKFASEQEFQKLEK